MYECESWTIRKVERWTIDAFESWCWRRSPLDSKEIKLVNLKGNQSWIFIGRTHAEAYAEAPILWPPDAKRQLIGKDSDAGEDWRQEEKGTTEDEMVGRHQELNGHELSQLRETVKDRETWRAAIHVVAKSWTWISNWTTTRHVLLASIVSGASGKEPAC